MSRSQHTTKDFIEKSREIHGDKYDYSLTTYQGCKKPLTIICPEHGPFTQPARNHTTSQSGCYKCSKPGRPKTSFGKFIEHARRIHGMKYEYISYTSSTEPVIIKCPKHGEFTVHRAKQHLRTIGGCCRTCMKEENQKKNLALFLANAAAVHGTFYDYSMLEYINAHTPVTILCPEHGEFTQYPLAHTTQGSGCPLCATQRYR
jgi:hypothetical protein